MAFSCTDLDNARFWLGSKKVLDKQIYLVKTSHCTVFFMILPLPYQVTQVAQILSSTSFSIPQKNVHLKALL